MSVDKNIEILSNKPAPVPKPAIAAIFILLVTVIAIVYIRSKPSSSQETVPGQELIVGVGRATLYVPKDAATLAGVISISPLEPNLHAVAGEEPEWYRSQVVNVEYLDRDGVPYSKVTFPKPVLICFMIEELWQDYLQRPDEFEVQYYAEEQRSPGWVALPMSDNAERYQLCGQTDHLSTFALAIIPPQEIPITGGSLFPTSMGSITPVSTKTPNPLFSPTPTRRISEPSTPISTRAALTATSIALTATDVPPTKVPPTNVLPTVAPTNAPTAVSTAVPTDPPPTDPPPTDPPPTDPPATDPPATDPPATDPPATEPPAATAPP
jgi:hypothetical protein